MINVEQISKEIDELKRDGSMSWDTMEKLCWLYTVRDHLQMDEGGSLQVGFRGVNRRSNSSANRNEDLENIERNMTREEVMDEFNEHMNDIRNRHPMDYENTVRRMRERYGRYSDNSRN